MLSFRANRRSRKNPLYQEDPHLSTKTLRPARPADLLSIVLNSLDQDKAENVVSIDLRGKTSIADNMVIGSGRSQRQVSAIARHLAERLKDAGFGACRIEGLSHGDWVLIDAGDVVVHVFRPEMREFYNLEKMWSVAWPETRLAV